VSFLKGESKIILSLAGISSRDVEVKKGAPQDADGGTPNSKRDCLRTDSAFQLLQVVFS